MPVYEYLCSKCEKKFEKLRSMARMDDPAECPECGTSSDRVLSPASFRMTGRPS